MSAAPTCHTTVRIAGLHTGGRGENLLSIFFFFGGGGGGGKEGVKWKLLLNQTKTSKKS